MFLVEGSRGMSSYDWMMNTHLVANFLEAVHVQPQYVHVGVVISDSTRGDTIGISPFKTK